MTCNAFHKCSILWYSLWTWWPVCGHPVCITYFNMITYTSCPQYVCELLEVNIHIIHLCIVFSVQHSVVYKVRSQSVFISSLFYSWVGWAIETNGNCVWRPYTVKVWLLTSWWPSSKAEQRIRTSGKQL